MPAQSARTGSPDSSVEPLLTYRDAARLLGITERSVWALVQRGEIPAVRFGRTVRIDPADLRAFIDSSKQADRRPPNAGGAHDGD